MRKGQASSVRVILQISFLDDLNVLALSELSVAGNLHLVVNLWMTSRKACTLRPLTNSKRTTRVEVQVKGYTYTLLYSLAPSEFPSETNNGAAKSRPTWVTGGSSETFFPRPRSVSKRLKFVRKSFVKKEPFRGRETTAGNASAFAGYRIGDILPTCGYIASQLLFHVSFKIALLML